MSKKHFIALADAIRKHNSKSPAQGIPLCGPIPDDAIEMLADFLADQNPRFNRDRWLDYIAGKCGPNGGSVKKAA